MFNKFMAVMGLLNMGREQNEPSEAAGNVLLKRQINNLKAELTLYKEIAKSRYEQNEPMKAKIKALETQNEYLRSTSDLMRETIEAQTEAMRAQAKASKPDFSEKCRNEAQRLYPTKNSSSFDSKNS